MERINSHFKKYHLNDKYQGRNEFFNEIMSTLESTEFATFKVGVEMDEGIGGYFKEKIGLNSINLPNTWKIDGNTVSYDDDKAFAIFVHECCHFLHLTRDEGKFISPIEGVKDTYFDMKLLKRDFSGKSRRNVEYEAGYRAMLMDRAYHMFPDDRRINLETNLINMINYDSNNIDKEIRKKMADLDKEKHKEFIENLVKSVPKFSMWADPKHKIEIPEELMDKLESWVK